VANILPVIMSGGSGTRLWPLSTQAQPKQFHALATPNSMIQETALRLSGEGFLKPVAICGRTVVANRPPATVGSA
jgi:mannose-1-phosphate guanylyltransferase